jgi:acylphosphatase
MTAETGNQRLHAIVEGWVQGVGFRAFVLDLSSQFGLSGWVRNTTAGHVEIVAEGNKQQLDQFLAFVWSGPRMSQIVNVQEEWLPATGEYSYFTIERTG